MNRYARVLAVSVGLLVVVAGSALATQGGRADEHRAPVAASHQPQSEEEGTGPSQQLLDKLVERLGEAGVDTDAETIAGLAATYGVGGAVRLLAWADAADLDPAALAAMFDSGMGWGEIARQLNDEDPEGDLELHPGIGWIMGGHGNGHAADAAAAGAGLGRASAPGQLKKQ